MNKSRENQILIVDDDPNILKSLKDILTRRGYIVETAPSGASALEKIQIIPPVITLCDLRLGDMSGLELIEKIKSISPDTECIMITGYGSQESAIEAVKVGAYSYILKPYKVEDLLNTIRLAEDKYKTVVALRASEERHREFFQNLPLGLFRLDINGNIVDCNQAFADLLGEPDRESVLNRSYREFIFDQSEITSLKLKIKKEGKLQTQKLKIKRSDGSVIWVEGIAKPGHSDDGKIINMEGSIQDISRRVVAEKQREIYLQVMETLHEIDRGILMAEKPAEIIESAVSNIIKLTSCSGVIFIVFDHDAQEFTVESVYNQAPSEIFKPGARFSMDFFFPNIESLSKGNPDIVDLKKIRSNSNMGDRLDKIIQAGILSIVSVPIIFGDDLIGALNVGFDLPRSDIKEEYILIIQELSPSLSVALKDASNTQKLKEAHEDLRQLNQRFIELQEVERKYIAHELHDELGSLLTGLKFSLDAALDLPVDQMRSKLAESIKQIDSALGEIRELSHTLRPDTLDMFGLEATLLSHFSRFTEQTQIDVAFEQIGLQNRIPQEMETTVFRIIQEALTNVARHAKATQVIINVQIQDGLVDLSIKDNGVGISLEIIKDSKKSLGLVGMRERVAMLNGEFNVSGISGEGTQIKVNFPIPIPS